MNSRQLNQKTIVFCLIIAVCSLASAFFTWFPITDSDIWWHLAAGREIITGKKWLFFDPFSYSINKPEWIDVHWLFQIAVYCIYSVSGYTGIVVTKCAAISLVCLLIAIIPKDLKGGSFAALIFAFTIGDIRYLVLERPVLVTLVCICLFILCIERYLSSKKWMYLLWLIPVQIIWTNSQGLFAIGFAIVICYAVGTSIDILLKKRDVSEAEGEITDNKFHWILILTAVALPFLSLINPYGIKGLTFPLRLWDRIDPSIQNVFSRAIAENIPLYSLRNGDLHYLVITIVVAMFMVTGFILLGKKRKWSHILLFVAFFYLSVRAMRNVLLFMTIAAPLCALTYRTLVEGNKNAAGKLLHTYRFAVILLVVGGAILAGIAVARHIRVIGTYPGESAISPFRVPDGAVKYLKTHVIPGRIFNADRFGGYILWEMYPDEQVYIDGRFILRSGSFFKEYLSLNTSPEKFTYCASKFGITKVVLPTAIFMMHMPLVKWLYKSKTWDLVYTDGATVLFVKNTVNADSVLRLNDSAVCDSIDRSMRKRWEKNSYITNENRYYFNQLVTMLTK